MAALNNTVRQCNQFSKAPLYMQKMIYNTNIVDESVHNF